MNNDQYTQLLLNALLAAKRAGEVILEVYNSDFAVEHKEDESPLTLADKRSHEIIMNDLQKTATGSNNVYTMNNPALPILSEEGKDIPFDERKGWEYFWLVDPLDGTKEFIKRNGEFTVNIALIYKERPLLGCIYIPVRDTFYFATVGLGAYKLANGKTVTDNLSIRELLDASQKLPMSTRKRKFPPCNNQSPQTKKSSLTIIGSRSHATKELSEFVGQARKQYEEVEFVSAGSSLKFCLVAEGEADIYPRFGPTMEWDTAAGQAIVEQAEGRVVDTQTNEPLKYNKNNLVNPFFIVTGKGFPAIFP
ncbi:MAG: 3'(2'),5'-bisphosphate nucleotidase CysQ [Candidatus Brocadia sp. AMX2]|uniref:3'(2'),5'-bisphosphate nucleotidase CysQ n=1 Tax=Candidatus Brocadia sinica JPN1 TaxID=1197129 RepID=A0ABQ0JWZ4_9BACT|nr:MULTISPECIES: 3'(2'),5'-bisphosphate nucleotidase CysQ [Brocadia]KXK30348.1 MAG: cysteine biosynthesis protein CysQ [Candidatus Brocadia sinica]MBC6931072.1 3'(2'),5'-bisphosphate nucleotidase CysQ [Candidatus Brocadia sp.]MBL1168151.1 3'(2'),5'-bisphosphate nucleotidase CysQ [Candidatus Brocadia sp. AMX1]NOG40923.1 3'(2'),5'-bisphosphate nucleotidase CysQ [Planctomycetota bacterium]KAA0241643.1 MAG: 3'(2'),5'-bisphosphate nucleotidase CysQ [Candidatus Brocadia sp. AMX2]